MRRGRGIIGGSVVVVGFAVFSQAAFAGAVDQGYPCATMPPAAPGQPASGACRATTPAAPSTPGPAATSGQKPGSQAGAQTKPTGVLGTAKTVSASKPVAAVAPVSAARATGALPFTGIQLGVVALFGLLLVGGGMLLRASGRDRTGP
jgi:hypothetical protein